MTHVMAGVVEAYMIAMHVVGRREGWGKGRGGWMGRSGP